jgi:glycosyltransferase involved in cell wall biosynthesis
MKILYCILDNRLGGPHRRAYAVSLRLRHQGVETLFLTGWKTDDLWRPTGETVFHLRGIQFLQRHHPVLNFIRFLFRLPHNILEIRRIIRSRDITIVHVDGSTNVVPALAAWWAGVPIVWHYNDHPPGSVKRMLEGLMGRLAARVIVQGEGLRQSRTARNPRLCDKTCVLHSAVDTDKLVPDAYDATDRVRMRAELGVPADGILIGAVGNLNRFKGYTYFLQAAAKIRERVDRVRFLIVGRRLDTDVAYSEHLLQQTAALGLQENVIFAGFRDDVPRVLAALDVFVLSSVLESCPLALLEAMAMKTPVVATDVGAVSEMVEHGRTGFVVPPADAEALAEAVLTVLARPKEQVRDLVDEARKTVERRFSLVTIAKQQLQVYQSLRGPHMRHV